MLIILSKKNAVLLRKYTPLLICPSDTAKNLANLNGGSYTVMPIITELSFSAFVSNSRYKLIAKLLNEQHLDKMSLTEVQKMKDKKFYINLTEQERSEIIHSLISKKNALIAQGRYTDAVDDVICKLMKAKKKTFQVQYI